MSDRLALWHEYNVARNSLNPLVRQNARAEILRWLTAEAHTAEDFRTARGMLWHLTKREVKHCGGRAA